MANSYWPGDEAFPVERKRSIIRKVVKPRQRFKRNPNKGNPKRPRGRPSIAAMATQEEWEKMQVAMAVSRNQAEAAEKMGMCKRAFTRRIAHYRKGFDNRVPKRRHTRALKPSPI